MKKDFLRKAKSVMIGHAVADALGVPVEFSSREELKEEPVTSMRGFGTYNKPKGTWSDDTSMSICALEAFNNGKIDFEKVMDNFAKWRYNNDFTATGITFDVGSTCGVAIRKYYKEGVPWDKCGLCGERDNGNGSLMRIHPFALYAFLQNINVKEKIEIIEKASSLTHAHPRSKIACGIYAFILWEILWEKDNLSHKETIKNGLKKAMAFYADNLEFKVYEDKLCKQIAKVFLVEDTGNNFKEITENEISSDGYVVYTLEAVIWCLLNTNSYAECVLKAVNLGNDTDTIAAIAGGLAGAIYGYDSIPKEWRETLIKREYLEELTEKAFS